MHHAQNTSNKISIFLLFLFLIHGQLVIAESTESENGTAIITMTAPESILAFLNQYFKLPDKAITSTTARLAFLRRAKKEISELLATEGYFTPVVVLQGNWHDDTDIPILSIEPGPLTKVSEVNIEFQGDIINNEPGQQADMKRIRDSWPLSTGEPFRSNDWEQAKATILSKIKGDKYAAAYIVDSKAVVDPHKSLVELTIVIDSGPVFYFGELMISGLERYDESAIKNFMLFRAGDPYTRKQLNDFQTALQDIPHFRSVSVDIEPDISQHQAIPVQVLVTEMEARHFAIGAGYGSNNGARGELNFRNHNLFEQAWYLNSTLRIEQKRQTVFTGIDTLPNQNNIQYSLGANLQTTDIEGLETINQRVGLTRNYRTQELLRQIGLTWQREEKRPSGAINQINTALVLDWQWRYHIVDDPLHIRKGHVAEIQVGGGSQQLLSEQDFVRSYGRYQGWWPVGEKDVFFLRGEAGYTLAQSRFGIPQEYLFRAGGIHSVRGYDFNSLGVREGNATVGGRVLATGTMEYTRWFKPHWGAAFFADIGSAADRWQKLNAFLGYGAGIRWRSPAGPLALDIARADKTGTIRFHFSLAVAF